MSFNVKPTLLDVYYPFKNSEGKMCPGLKPVTRSLVDVIMSTSDKKLLDLVNKVTECDENGDKEGKAEAKKQLPAVTWCCTTDGRTRGNAHAKPTQLVMVDIDHITNMPISISEILERWSDNKEFMRRTLAIHVTPSGHGIRIVFFAWEDLHTLSENMERCNELFGLSEYGDFDADVHDFARLSFLVNRERFLFINEKLIEEGFNYEELPLVNAGYDGGSEAAGNDSASKAARKDIPEITEEEELKFKEYDYRGTPVTVIRDKYIDARGNPSAGEVHNFYNELVKYFRCICSNNKRLLFWLLPKFGHTDEECWSQIKSICKVNTLSDLPKPFYFFLKDNGFYAPKTATSDRRYNQLMSEGNDDVVMPPYLPPVFREFVRIAPRDFVYPVINSLLPILGTLTSYAQAIYPYDNREHTTSFFSVIYAPPGTGKGFVERFMDLLFEDLKLRDEVQSARENIYLRTMSRKGANDKAPEAPHVSLRLIPAKNSEAEFLQKQKDNDGYHMFTYAAEMDSWAKGSRAAGGNKDDMIRIAWDNGEYGQQFKAVNTFKGTVRLYWNVLITGTYQQLISYFKNVENGLVTRCGFTSIENQEFAPPPIWKKLSKRDRGVIRNFTLRCDMNTYETPCDIVPTDLLMVKDEDFDKEIDWHFKFKPRRTFDCSWIMPTIDRFHAEQTKEAALALDKARDVFRRRVAVRGFRLAIMCMCLWENPRKQDLEKCATFIDWYMHKDIEEMLRLWGEAYNGIEDAVSNIPQRNLFAELPDTFNANDVYTLCIKHNIKTPVRRIVFEWNRIKVIEKLDKKTYKKIQKKK